jgi:hypothetical protein
VAAYRLAGADLALMAAGGMAPAADPGQLTGYADLLSARIGEAIKRAEKRMGPQWTWRADNVLHYQWKPENVPGTISAVPDSSTPGGYQLHIQVQGSSTWARTLNSELAKITSPAPQ